MNFVSLSPHFPPNFGNFCIQLANRGVNVLGIADVPLEDLRPELRESFTDYYQVTSLESEDQLQRALGWLIWRQGRVERIESHIEHWLGLEACLREDFNLIGPKRRETEAFRRKSSMKQAFKSAGIPVAAGELYRDLPQTLSLADRVAYPLIAKPDIGVGGAGTYKLKNREDVERFAKEKPPVDYILEEFLTGELITFDGLTDGEGRIIYENSLYCGIGIFDILEDNVDCSYYTLRKIDPELARLGRIAVQTFNLKERFFHIEFWYRPEHHDWKIMEINCRPPGGYSLDMMNFSADIDLYAEYANIVTGGRISCSVDRRHSCAHISRRYGKSYKWSHEEVMHRYRHEVVAVTELPAVFAQVMGNIVYLVRSPDEDKVREMIAEIQATS